MTTEQEVRRYGCFNRPAYKSALTVFDGYHSKARNSPKTKEIPFRMAMDCRYTHSQEGRDDARCNGCAWRVAL